MINFDGAKKNIKELNRNCPKTPNHPYRISIIGDSGSGKTSALLNLIKKKQDNYDYSIIDKIYLYVKDSHGAKYQHFI